MCVCGRGGAEGPGWGQRAISLKVYCSSLCLFFEPGQDEDNAVRLSPSCADSGSTGNTR